jgi:uncharacterized protein (TIGR00251 family)
MRALPFVGRSKDGALIEVFVQPRAARDSVEGIHGDALKLKVKAPPVDDRANRAIEKLLADLLDLPPSTVAVVAGHSSRRKRIAVTGASREQVENRLNRVLTPGT